jgi:hypothetical protein
MFLMVLLFFASLYLKMESRFFPRNFGNHYAG